MLRVALIEPRSSGLQLIERAARLGIDVVVLTADRGERTIPAAFLSHATHVEIVDTNDDARTLAVLAELHDRAPLDAVIPGFEHYVPLAAVAAGALGLPGLPPETALRLRHKHVMRAAVAAAGIDQPRFVVVSSEAELSAAVETVGLPCVIKPVDQSGSLHVRKAASLAECVDAFGPIIASTDAYLDRIGLPLALVEEYVSGAEFSVEGYVDDGTPHIVGVTEKQLGPEPSFVEIGHVVPAVLAARDDAAVRDYARAAVLALGLRLGPFHAELRLCERGPMLMEVAARLPGDRIPDLLRLAGGADLYEIMINAYLGRAVPAPGRPTRHAGVRYFMRPDLRSHAGLRLPLDDRHGLHECGELIPAGQPIPHPGSSSSRIGYAIAVRPSYESTMRALDAAQAAVRIEDGAARSRHVLILNRWRNRFAEYHRYIDHAADRVAYICTPDAVEPLDVTQAEDIVVVPDLADRSAVLAAAADLTCRHGPFTAVLALSEFDLELGAEIRAALGISGKLPAEVHLVRDKIAMKAAVARAGLRVPANIAVTDAGQVRGFARAIGLPVVLKPRDGADSQGVLVVRNADQLEDALAAVDLSGYECEEFVAGSLYQIDGIVSAGRLRTIRSWRCIGSCLDFATGTSFGSVANDDAMFERRIVTFAQGVLAALRLTDDVFHLEVFREDGTDELVFLEIGARAGGGQVRYVWEEVYGLDLVEASVHVQLGIERDYPRADIAGTEVAGYLMMPEPPIRPCVVHEVGSLLGRVPELYSETLPAAGSVLDGNGGAVNTAGAFRFRARTSDQVRAAIARAQQAYRIDWSPKEEVHG